MSVKFMGYIVVGNEISSKYDYSTVILNFIILCIFSMLLFHLPFQNTVGLMVWYILIYIILFFSCLNENEGEKENIAYQFILIFYSIVIIGYSSYSIERFSHNLFKLSLELKLKSDEASRANNAKSDYVNQLFHDVYIIIIVINSFEILYQLFL